MRYNIAAAALVRIPPKALSLLASVAILDAQLAAAQGFAECRLNVSSRVRTVRR